MTQSIESMIEVLQAYKDGKTIEYLSTMDGTWSSCIGEPLFNFDVYQYRIAPEQKKKVKYLCWDMNGYLGWRKEDSETIPPSWIRVPSEDKEVEI